MYDELSTKKCMPMNGVFNIANSLTLFRVLLIPLMVLTFYIPTGWAHVAAAAFFSVAAITDWLDGLVARKWQMESRFGAFLDPVADKMMVAVALILVATEHGGALVGIPAAVIIMREIFISALREWMAELGKRASVAVSLLGKLKTAVQMVALLLLIIYTPNYFSSHVVLYSGYVCLYFSTILTLWSMFVYIRLAWADLTIQHKES
jgi:CDP-diacylglycerol--glycerol-3-phosphate 3-phosphatidyltransferase